MKIKSMEVYTDDEMKKAVFDVLDSGRYINGDRLKEFERKFAQFVSIKYAIGVSSGTAAILLSLLAANVKTANEVIVPSHSFIATASPVKILGAKPVFADIYPSTYTVDPDDVRRKFSEKTKAIIPVHLYGHPADMDEICEIAGMRDSVVIEDACQAHGASYKGKKAGAIGDIGCFSFYPSKNMTVCGDGGMIVTNNEEYAEKIKMLRDHGRKEKYLHELLGFNFRMSEISASIGIIQLKYLEKWNEKRRMLANLYSKLFHDYGLDENVLAPMEKKWARHVYHLYVIRTEKRDLLKSFLQEKGIETGIHYPVPIHKQPCMKASVSLPTTEKIVDEILSLPMHPHLKEEEVRYVTEQIARFWRKII